MSLHVTPAKNCQNEDELELDDALKELTRDIYDLKDDISSLA
jgi:hypothetical protein